MKPMTTHTTPSTSTTVHKSENVRECLLTIEEVAEILKVPISWVYGKTRKRGMDRIPGFRLGKYWRFREADVLAWLDRQRAGGRTNA
jgi:excisionase family DNA binding protein